MGTDTIKFRNSDEIIVFRRPVNRHRAVRTQMSSACGPWRYYNIERFSIATHRSFGQILQSITPKNIIKPDNAGFMDFGSQPANIHTPLSGQPSKRSLNLYDISATLLGPPRLVHSSLLPSERSPDLPGKRLTLFL